MPITESQRIAKKKYYDANRYRILAHARATRVRTPNGPEQKEYFRKRYQDKKREIQSQRLFKKFGITLDEYDVMFAAQGSVCAICKQAPKGKNRLAVDHDHTTGKVRDLLCTLCNRFGVFLAEDHPHIYPASQCYVSRHKTTDRGTYEEGITCG